MNLDVTPCRCKAVNSSWPCPIGQRKSRSFWMSSIGVLNLPRLPARLCGEYSAYFCGFSHGSPPCSHSSNHSSSVVPHILSKFHTEQCVTSHVNCVATSLTANQFIMYPPKLPPADAIRFVSTNGHFATSSSPATRSR